MTDKLNRNDWGTPQDLFNVLNDEFHFTLDAAASAENTKCFRFRTKDNDAIIRIWRNETVFCNPPFGARGVKGQHGIAAWLEKGVVGLWASRNSTSVIFAPGDPSTKWFKHYAPLAWQVRLCAHPRVRFVPPKGIKESSPRSSIAIFIFSNEFKPSYHQDLILWDWQQAVADLATKKEGG